MNTGLAGYPRAARQLALRELALSELALSKLAVSGDWRGERALGSRGGKGGEEGGRGEEGSGSTFPLGCVL